MMPDIKKILYTTDLSKNAIFAFQYAAYLSKKLGSEIIILHVIEKMSADAQLTLMAYLDKEDRRRFSEERVEHTVEQIKNSLKIFCQKVLKDQKANLDQITTIEVCEGYPEDQILKKAKEFDCDAIIMGTNEKGVSNTFLGSIAKRVLSQSRNPVIIVPLPKDETTLPFYE